MQDTEEFESWLFKLITDAKRKLGMTDRTIAYILLREGINHYLKQITEEDYGIRDPKKHLGL